MNVAMLEMIMQIRVRVTGAAPEKYGRSLFIMNNRSSLDWMWFWLYAYHYHGVSKLKFLIRGSLKLVPGYGWIMQQAAYLFIQGRWNKDEKAMQRVINYWKRAKIQFNLLYFPEGRPFSAENKRLEQQKSQVDKDTGERLQHFTYLLNPKSTGFTFLINRLRDVECLDYVYDVTIGYPKEVKEVKDFIKKGEYPKEIHLHIEKFHVDTLPTTTPGLEKWLRARWEEKDERLSKFYCDPEQLSASQFRRTRLSRHKFADDEQSSCYRKRKTAKVLAFIFWTASFLGYGYMLVYRVYYWSQTKYYILIYHIAMSFMYMIVSVIGGFEKVLAASSRWYCGSDSVRVEGVFDGASISASEARTVSTWA